MKDKTPVHFGPNVSRRQLLGAAGATAGAASALSVVPWTVSQAQVEQMQSEGWEPNPLICHMCGGACGLLAMHKKGTSVSRETVRIVPNPTHPQRGYCGRGASAMWTWNHPLRLKKPMKRVGKRGEGKFVECSWDEALDGIAKQVRQIVDKDGERAICLTSHSYSNPQKWFASALGTPNLIKHCSTCNTGSVIGRRLVYGKGFDGAGKIEPDYSRVRFLLMLGRSLNCAIGVANVVQRARLEGSCQVTFVDPRMPEGALNGSDWIGIKPGRDAALIMAMLNIAVAEGLADEAFLAKHTNAAYLVTGDEKPVTQAMLVKGGSSKLFAVVDAATGRVSCRGVDQDKRFVEDAAVNPDLRFKGEVTLADGTRQTVTTAFNLLMDRCARFTPAEAARETGIDANRIVKLARDFFTLGGVADDGWYSARNGNDAETFALVNVLNLFTGHFDREGGLVVTQGGGFKGPGVSLKGNKGKGPAGQTWTIDGETRRLDTVYYPESTGTFSAIFEAIHTGKPYPVRGLFVTGSTMFHREPNTQRMIDALMALDLVVVQDIFPHEIVDYADYVLPSTYFLERVEYGSVKWNVNGNVHANGAGFFPPEGNESRDEIWQFCEILRRAYPDRAAERLGYDREIKTAQEWREWYKPFTDKAWGKFIAGLNKKNPGEGDRVFREVHGRGWSKVADKKFGVYPYVKPVGTPTGKPEIVSFMVAQKYGANHSVGPVFDYHRPPAYSEPKPDSDEFFLISGKDSSSTSGATLFQNTVKFLGDRTLWMNPADGKRLGIATGDKVELTSLDTQVTVQSEVKLTNRVRTGVLFRYGFSGGSKTRQPIKGYEWVREGFNSHNLCTGYAQPVSGNVANNTSVRIKRI